MTKPLQTLRACGRRLANLAARCIPKPLVRLVLKSFWQQPQLQDALRFHVEPYRYESAIPTSRDVDRGKLSEQRSLPGIELDAPAFVQRLNRLLPFAGEFAKHPIDRVENAEFWFHNGSFEDFDAVTLYAMVRDLKPKRLIEVGCGLSTRVIGLATRQNAAEQRPCECVHIEPYPSEDLRRNMPPGKFLQQKIQDVPLKTFQTLEAGDIFFIDSTHILKTQSDCCYELLEIIPSLKPGVFIHIHDIYTPFDYPAEWLLDSRHPYNEQYGLECLLTLSPAFEIVLPVYFLYATKRQQLQELLSRGSSRACSFWIRKVN